MSYDVNNFTKLADLKLMAQRTAAEIEAVSGIATDAAHTGTADFTVDFPTELFLDQTRTMFVPNFTFSAATYPGAVNPSLDGKPVMVLAVKGTTDTTSGTVNDTITYSFLDVSALVDTYTVKTGDSAKIITISGYEVEVHISSAANNAIEVKNDGLYVSTEDKADKVANATAGHLAGLDANGNLTDSGAGIATTAEVTEMLNEVFGAPAQDGE